MIDVKSLLNRGKENGVTWHLGNVPLEQGKPKIPQLALVNPLNAPSLPCFNFWTITP
jgi:hypothetical protein